jgi:hypothetical protein
MFDCLKKNKFIYFLNIIIKFSVKIFLIGRIIHNPFDIKINHLQINYLD